MADLFIGGACNDVVAGERRTTRCPADGPAPRTARKAAPAPAVGDALVPAPGVSPSLSPAPAARRSPVTPVTSP